MFTNLLVDTTKIMSQSEASNELTKKRELDVLVEMFPNLLPFSQTCELLSSKAAFTIVFFSAVNHNYDHEQQTLKHRNTQNGSKSTNHKSQTLTFWTCQSKVLFSKRSAKMIDGSEKRNCQLAFELHNSHVSEKRSKAGANWTGSGKCWFRFGESHQHTSWGKSYRCVCMYFTRVNNVGIHQMNNI